MADGETHRISISEERLKLLLSDLELRLRIYFDERLSSKADFTAMTKLAQQVDALDRGDFTPVHERALREFIEGTLSEGGNRKWAQWQKIISVCAILVTIMSFIITVLITFGGVG